MKKAAIYAWYNSDNKREKSLKGQIGSCMRYAELNGLEATPDHVYTDMATSGALHDRPGLKKLLQAVKAKRIDFVLVDDLSRLSQDGNQVLRLILELEPHRVCLLTVKDNFDTIDVESYLHYRIKDALKMAYLYDLRLRRLRRANQKMNDVQRREEV